MTKKEFITKQQEMTRFGNKRMIVWLIVLFGGIICGIPISDYIEKHELPRWCGAVVGIGLFVFLLGNLALLIWFAKRQQKRFGGICSSCGKAFRPSIAIACGNCSQCGEPVFHDGAGVAPASPPSSRESDPTLGPKAG